LVPLSALADAAGTIDATATTAAKRSDLALNIRGPPLRDT
jgi:hypothetical protein